MTSLPPSLAAALAGAVDREPASTGEVHRASRGDRSRADATGAPETSRFGPNDSAAPLRLVGLSGGVGEPSSTTTVVRLVLDATAARLAAQSIDSTIEIVEVRTIARDATDEVLGGLRSTQLDSALASIEGADALVVASPVFRGSYAGVFKTVLDLLEAGSLRGTPAVLAATTGTVRHTLVTEHALRPLMSYLGALTLPTTIVATPEDLVLGTRAIPELAERVERSAQELVGALSRTR